METVATPSEATTGNPAPSLDDRILSTLGGLESTEETQPAAADAPSQEATQTGDEELQLEEAEPVNPDATQQAIEDFELVHNGQTLKVTREKAKALAQQGYDYGFKMQRVNGEYQKLQSMAAAIQSREAVRTQALDAMAEAKAYEKQLAAYANVDWVRESEADPIRAYQARMRFDALVTAFNGAQTKVQEAQQKAEQTSQQITQDQVALEKTRLLERIPEWRDAVRAKTESGELLQALSTDYGFTGEELQQYSWLLNDHRFISLARDGYKYRKAVANQKAKKGPAQGLPAVSKPGARQLAPSTGETVANIKRGLHQPNVSKEQRKALTDHLIAAKFGLK